LAIRSPTATTRWRQSAKLSRIDETNRTVRRLTYLTGALLSALAAVVIFARKLFEGARLLVFIILALIPHNKDHELPLSY
jgi:hypothetical protein